MQVRDSHLLSFFTPPTAGCFVVSCHLGVTALIVIMSSSFRRMGSFVRCPWIQLGHTSSASGFQSRKHGNPITHLPSQTSDDRAHPACPPSHTSYCRNENKKQKRVLLGSKNPTPCPNTHVRHLTSLHVPPQLVRPRLCGAHQLHIVQANTSRVHVLSVQQRE